MSKYVLITGASRGIGRACAIKFAREGYGIIATCHSSTEKLMELKEQILALEIPCQIFTNDISNYNDVLNMCDNLKSLNCMPDILINNAAISYVGLLQDMTVEEWHRLLDINLTGAFNLCKILIPFFIKQGTGKIINISSMWGNTGASCEVAYSASKGGLNSFTKALAKELAPSNIPVNAIAFGMVDTQMNAFLTHEERTSFIQDIPAGRIILPEEAADIIYNVSCFNSYVTGQIITADGGYT